MKNVLNAQGVRDAESELINGGLDVMLLRFNAALAVADGIYARASAVGAKTAVFCGPGGNGYDGILAACRLKRLGCDVRLYLVGKREAFDASSLKYAENCGLKPFACGEYGGGANVIIDAIFGIGLNREITGETKSLIERLNSEQAFRLAVDIPSGLNADTGMAMGVAFRADVTVTFSCYKIGQLFDGAEYCGKIIVEDVGIPTRSSVKVCEDADFKPIRRKKTAHKGTSGRIFVIGGSGNMIGAPIMAGAAAHAATLSGAGTVTVCLPSVHRAAATSRVTMAMLKFLPDTTDGFIRFDKKSLDEIMEKASAIVIGMGMGAAPELNKIVKYVCENYDGALVIDADAINAIKHDYAFIKNGKAKVALTPHVGEFRRLTGKEATVENAAALARELGAVVALKSSTTIITDGNEVRLNITGTPAMAKGGMGDVLGGCIAALSCSFSLFDAACVACYRNGLGAENAVKSYSELMLTARDVLNFAGYDEI